MIIKIATTPFPLSHILGSQHMPQRFYVLLLKKVRLLGRLYLRGFWGLGVRRLLLFYCYPNFLNSFFADPYKITASKGGLTHPLKI
jgi:hypothetical protein